MAINSTEPWLLRVAKGLIPHHSVGTQHGYNPEVTELGAGDLWGGKGIYQGQEKSFGEIQVVSDSVLDNFNDRGAITVEIVGLNEHWEIQRQLINMNGTTPVTVLDNPGNPSIWRRVIIARVMSAGAMGSNIGNITLNQGTNVIALIGRFKKESEIAAFTVPLNHTAYILGYRFSMLTTNGGALAPKRSLLQRIRGGLWRQLREERLIWTEPSSYEPANKIKLEERSDFKMQISDVYPKSTRVLDFKIEAFGSFDYLLVRNEN